MSEHVRTDLQREADLDRIAMLHAQGKTQLEIAGEIGISRSQVAYDIADLRKRWRESSLSRMDDAALEIEQIIRWTYRKACSSFLKSLQDGEETVVEETTDSAGNKGDGKTRTKTTGQCGDPRFLNVINDCAEKLAKLHGAYKPVKTTITDPDGNVPATIAIDVASLSRDELKVLTLINLRNGRPLVEAETVPVQPERGE